MLLSCSPFPFRPILYRLHLWRLSRQAAGGDIPAVRALAAIFCTSPNPRIRAIAGRRLTHLERSDQADLLCRESLLRDNPDLVNLVTGCGYLPSVTLNRALWFFCTARIDDLRRLDPGDNFPLLAAGYTSGDETIRARARNAARRDGNTTILAHALTGGNITRNAASWFYAEWEIVVSGLVSGKRWDDLWLLVPLAPLPLAMKAVRALLEAGWSPRGDDHLAWDNLVAALPDRWTYPLLTGNSRDAASWTSGQVVRSCFSPDGSLIATGSSDGMIVVRQVVSSGPSCEFSAGPCAVRFLAIPAGEDMIISAEDSGILRCHDLHDGSLLWSHEGGREEGVVALSSDGGSVLVGNSAGTLRVLGIRDGKLLASLNLHSSAVTCIAVVPDHPDAACGHADGSVSICLPRDGMLLKVLPGNGSPVLSIAFDPAGSGCLVVYERGFPVRWDPSCGEILGVYHGYPGKTVCCTAPTAGGWFAVGSDDHVIRCWEMNGKAPVAAIPLYKRDVVSCSADPEGKYLSAGFLDGSVRIWSMPRAVLVRELKGHKKTVTSCIFTPDSRGIATVSWDGTTKIWRVPGMEILRTFDSHSGGIAALAGPAGTLVAAVTADGIARLIDGSEGTVLRSLDLYVARVRAAALSPDGSMLAITGSDSSIRCWNTNDGSLVASGTVQGTSHRCCTFVPDGSALVAGGWDGACRVFSLPGMDPLRTLYGHTSNVTCCTVSKDGSFLVSGSNDTTIRFWRNDEEEAFAVIGESRSEVGAVALSPEGEFLAAGYRDGDVRLYRLPYGTFAFDLPGLTGRVTSLAFADGGCLLAAGYDSGICALYSVPDHALLGTMPVHSSAVTGLVILPGGMKIITSGIDGRCRVSDLPAIPFASRSNPSDIPEARGERGRIDGNSMGGDVFHRALLTARFREEIMISLPPGMSTYYDIQIVG